MLAWLEIDFQQAEGQKEWLRRQRAELGGARFAEHLAEYLDASLVAAVLECRWPASRRTRTSPKAPARPGQPRYTLRAIATRMPRMTSSVTAKHAIRHGR